MEFLVRVVDGADLVLFIDQVPDRVSIGSQKRLDLMNGPTQASPGVQEILDPLVYCCSNGET